MQTPAVGNMEALKQVAKFLIAHGRFIQEFVRQTEEPSHVVVFTDSDHAGCMRTRDNTSSSKLFYGSQMLRSTSTTQAVIPLSSGESEFHALVKGRNRHEEPGIRHIATPTFWVLRLKQDAKVNITKIPGARIRRS